jgi:predicted NBD/HSP70 family sugar kinase
MGKTSEFLQPAEWSLILEMSETALRAAAIELVGPSQLDVAWVHDRIPVENIRADLLLAIDQAINRAETRPAAVVVVADGMLDEATGTVAVSFPTRRWHDLPLARWIDDALGVHTTLLRYGEAVALGEHFAGAAQRTETFLSLFVDDDDVHAGWFVDGELVRAIRGSFGNIIIDPASTESSAHGVDGALAAFSSIRGMLRGLSATGACNSDRTPADSDMREHLLVSHPSGIAALDKGARALAAAVAGTIDGSLFAGAVVLPVSVIIIGTRDPQIQDRLVRSMRNALVPRFGPTLDVRGGRLGDLAPVVGGAAHATVGDQTI